METLLILLTILVLLQLFQTVVVFGVALHYIMSKLNNDIKNMLGD